MSMPVSRRRSSRYFRSIALAALLGLFAFVMSPTLADAHARNENYVWLNVEEDGLSGRIDFLYNDLRKGLGIEFPDDVDGKAAALIENAPEIERFISENLAIIANGEVIPFVFEEPMPVAETPTRFGSFPFTTQPFDVPDRITLRNNLFLSWDTPLYRSLVVVEYDRQRRIEYPPEFAVMAFGPDTREQELDLSDLQPILQPADFIWRGFLHVVMGADHLLFLLALLLVSVLRLQPPRSWAPVTGPLPAFWNAFLVVTLFTVAHSVTLSMTVWGLIQPNTRVMETLAALSIMLIALNNLYPLLGRGRWALIAGFGLFHGIGFASAMNDMQFRLVEPFKTLFNFSAGVEFGQIVIVLVVLPLFYMLRNGALYRKGMFLAGNAAVAAIAAYWTITRAIGV